MFKIHTFLQGVFVTFVLSTLIVPSWIINKVMFLILLGVFFFDLLKNGVNGRIYLAPFVVILLFTYGYIIAIFGEFNPIYRQQFYVSGFVLLLVHVLIWRKIDAIYAFEVGAKVIVVATFTFWASLLFPEIPRSEAIFQWFLDNSFSSAVERDFAGSELLWTFSLGTTSFVFFAYCYCLIRFFEKFNLSDLVWICMYFVVMALSGRRGLILIAIAFLVIIILFRGKLFWKMGLLVSVIGTVFYGYLDFVINNTSVFSATETSNAVKIGHLSSYFNQLNAFEFFFGSGLGSYYYSSGAGARLAHTELTPFDMARYIGVPFVILLYTVFLLPTINKKYIRKVFSIYGLIMMLYLVLSITNPVLINSYGLLTVVWHWYYMLNSSDKSHPLRTA